MIIQKENTAVSKFSGALEDFTPVRDNLDLIISFNSIYESSLVHISLGGLILTEGNDFLLYNGSLRLYEREDEYLEDNFTIMIFKQVDWGKAL